MTLKNARQARIFGRVPYIIVVLVLEPLLILPVSTTPRPYDNRRRSSIIKIDYLHTSERSLGLIACCRQVVATIIF
jgi:hypothetical protein